MCCINDFIFLCFFKTRHIAVDDSTSRVHSINWYRQKKKVIVKISRKTSNNHICNNIYISVLRENFVSLHRWPKTYSVPTLQLLIALRLLTKKSTKARKVVVQIVKNIIRQEIRSYNGGPMHKSFTRQNVQDFSWEDAHKSMAQNLPTLYALIVTAVTKPSSETTYL